MTAVAALRSLPDGVPWASESTQVDMRQARAIGNAALLHGVGAGQDAIKALLIAAAQFKGGRRGDVVQEGEGTVGAGVDRLLDDDAAAGLVGVGAAHRLARVQVDRGRLRGHIACRGHAVVIAVRAGQAGERIAGRRLLGDVVLPHRLVVEGLFLAAVEGEVAQIAAEGVAGAGAWRFLDDDRAPLHIDELAQYLVPRFQIQVYFAVCHVPFEELPGGGVVAEDQGQIVARCRVVLADGVAAGRDFEALQLAVIQRELDQSVPPKPKPVPPGGRVVLRTERVSTSLLVKVHSTVSPASTLMVAVWVARSPLEGVPLGSLSVHLMPLRPYSGSRPLGSTSLTE